MGDLMLNLSRACASSRFNRVGSYLLDCGMCIVRVLWSGVCVVWFCEAGLLPSLPGSVHGVWSLCVFTGLLLVVCVAGTASDFDSPNPLDTEKNYHFYSVHTSMLYSFHRGTMTKNILVLKV